METGIKNKDSGLPISKMIVLDDDARPLELQACQPQGEAKFHLKMKSGGLVRVRTNVVSAESTYKTVFIARCTTARQLINLVMSGCKTDESPDNFKLREASADFNVDRILRDDEYPLEIQTKWKTNEGRVFFLTRVKNEVDMCPSEDSPISTSEELNIEMAKQNQTLDTLNEAIQRLQQEREKSAALSPVTSECSDFDQEDYDGIDDISDMTQTFNPTTDNDTFNEAEENVEKLRQRRTSIDALDLPYNPSKNKTNGIESERLTSQIDKLRHSFYQFKTKKGTLDDIDLIRKNEIEKEKPKHRQRTQIDRFRNKLLQYYSVKAVTEKKPIRRVQSTLSLPAPSASRSWSASDADYIPHLREIEQMYSQSSSSNSLCDQEIKEVLGSSPVCEQGGSPHVRQRTLHDVLSHMELISVTLDRKPNEGLGLELAHVTQIGSPVESDVVYVYHGGDGETAVFEGPVRDVNSDAGSSVENEYKDEEGDVFSESSEIHDENHNCFGSQSRNSSEEITPSLCPDSVGVTACTSGEATKPGSCCALAEWREGPGPKPRHGVRIVGITKGSIAEKSGILETDDVIVEVNGQNVLNSTLNVVIETMREQETVHFVVARENESTEDEKVSPENTPVGSSPVPSYHEDMLALTQQVEQLVAKVTELQEAVTKKDRTIARLRKSMMKKRLKISPKEKIVEAVQVIV